MSYRRVGDSRWTDSRFPGQAQIICPSFVREVRRPQAAPATPEGTSLILPGHQSAGRREHGLWGRLAAAHTSVTAPTTRRAASVPPTVSSVTTWRMSWNIAGPLRGPAWVAAMPVRACVISDGQYTCVGWPGMGTVALAGQLVVVWAGSGVASCGLVGPIGSVGISPVKNRAAAMSATTHREVRSAARRASLLAFNIASAWSGGTFAFWSWAFRSVSEVNGTATGHQCSSRPAADGSSIGGLAGWL